MDADLSALVLIDLLRAGRTARFTVRGGSMWPAIRDGARVEVTPCTPDVLRPGELAAFARHGTIVVHRLVTPTDAGFVFRGDALAQDDPLVAPDMILGRVRVIERPDWTPRLPGVRDAALLLRAARVRARCWWSALTHW